MQAKVRARSAPLTKYVPPALQKQVRPQDNPVYTGVVWILVFAACIALLAYVSATKTVVISETGGSAHAGDEISEIRESGFVPLLSSNAVDRVIRIPLPEKGRAEDVSVENLYLDNVLHIHIHGATEEFYQRNAISGDLSMLTDVRCMSTEADVAITFTMSELFEYRSTIDGQSMEISVQRPRDVYPFIVLLDPSADAGYGDLTLEIAKRAAELGTNEKVRVYLTRTDAEDAEGEREEVPELLSKTGADALIRISVGEYADASSYGVRASYNSGFFLPEYGNVDLCEALVRCTAIASGNRGLSIDAAGEESILRQAELPAGEVFVGNAKNAKEWELLENPAYREKIAAGIAAAIAEASQVLSRE